LRLKIRPTVLDGRADKRRHEAHFSVHRDRTSPRMLALGVVASSLGANRFLTSNGLNLGALLGFAAVMGFGGAFISLLMSKWMAKMSTGAQVITQPQSADEAWLLDTRRRALSQRAGIEMPEVAIYGKANPMPLQRVRLKILPWWRYPRVCRQGMTREEVEAGVGPRGGPHRQRRHGHADLDPRRAQHLCGVLEPSDWLCGATAPCAKTTKRTQGQVGRISP
jgi:hypothetical protein